MACAVAAIKGHDNGDAERLESWDVHILAGLCAPFVRHGRVLVGRASRAACRPSRALLRSVEGGFVGLEYHAVARWCADCRFSPSSWSEKDPSLPIHRTS